jgi:hypothetical protein
MKTLKTQDITGRAQLEAWDALAAEVGDDAAGVHNALGMSSSMLVQLAEKIEAGEYWFEPDEVRAARLVVDACTAALARIEHELF